MAVANRFETLWTGFAFHFRPLPIKSTDIGNWVARTRCFARRVMTAGK